MFYPAAKVLIQSNEPHLKQKLLLISREIEGQRYYEPAGGRANIDFDQKRAENFEQCALREVAEELGLLVSLEGYVGSYSFFWSMGKNCSCCALFLATLTGKVEPYLGNPDKDELPMTSHWVSLEEILSQKCPINPRHLGLEELIIRSFGH